MGSSGELGVLGVKMVKSISILLLRVMTGAILLIVALGGVEKFTPILVSLEPYFTPYASMATVQTGVYVFQLVMAGAVILGVARLVFLPLQMLVFAYSAGLAWISSRDQMAFGFSIAEVDMFLLPLTITVLFGASLVQFLDRGSDLMALDRLVFRRR